VSVQTLNYRGINRRGVHVTGTFAAVHPTAVSTFVEGKYNARWRWLEVTYLNGEVAGEIYEMDEGGRTWWAEIDTPLEDAGRSMIATIPTPEGMGEA